MNAKQINYLLGALIALLIAAIISGRVEIDSDNSVIRGVGGFPYTINFFDALLEIVKGERDGDQLIKLKVKFF